MSLNQRLYAGRGRPRRMWPAFATLGVVALLAAGAWFVLSGRLGDSDPTAGSPVAPRLTGFPSAGATTSPTSARLAAITVHRGDLSSDWIATPSTGGSAGGTDDSGMTACIGARDTTPDQTDEVDSPTYNSGSLSIMSSADSLRSQADITSDVAMLHSPKVNGCLQKHIRGMLGDSLPAGVRVAQARVAMVRPTGLPHNVAGLLSARFTLTGNGRTVTLYLDLAMIVGLRVEAEVIFLGVGHAVPAALRSQLAKKVAVRAAQPTR